MRNLLGVVLLFATLLAESPFAQLVPRIKHRLMVEILFKADVLLEPEPEECPETLTEEERIERVKNLGNKQEITCARILIEDVMSFNPSFSDLKIEKVYYSDSYILNSRIGFNASDADGNSFTGSYRMSFKGGVRENPRDGKLEVKKVYCFPNPSLHIPAIDFYGENSVGWRNIFRLKNLENEEISTLDLEISGGAEHLPYYNLYNLRYWSK
jgi:hypothetical protein